MKINVNNGNYLQIEIDKTLNRIQIYKFDYNGNILNIRCIDDFEMVDLYNILVYAQDNNKDIVNLWGIK